MRDKIKAICVIISIAAIWFATGYLAGYERGRFDYNDKDFAKTKEVWESYDKMQAESERNYKKHTKQVDSTRDVYIKLIDSIYNLKK